MHFHLPKPLHGWREFAGEVGIIVLGVLIALGAEQAIESWRNRYSVDEMHMRLRTEISVNLVNTYERLAINRCMTDRISQLRDLLVHSDGDWIGQPARFGGNFYVNVMPPVYRVPNRDWPTSAWNAANADGVIAKVSDDQSRRYSTIYSFVGNMAALEDRERDEEADLGDLAFTTRLSDTARNQHLRTLARLDDLNARFINFAQSMIDASTDAGIRLSRSDKASTVRLDRQFRGTCAIMPSRNGRPV